MREFKVSVEMDRMPSVNATVDELQYEVTLDNLMMKELRHGLGCGCRTCVGFAKQQREKTRGQELPTDAAGNVLNPFRRK